MIWTRGLCMYVGGGGARASRNKHDLTRVWLYVGAGNGKINNVLNMEK